MRGLGRLLAVFKEFLGEISLLPTPDGLSGANFASSETARIVYVDGHEIRRRRLSRLQSRT